MPRFEIPNSMNWAGKNRFKKYSVIASMIRNLHMLMALPSENGAIAFAAMRAEFLPIEGLRLYFPSGHQTRLEKIEY